MGSDKVRTSISLDKGVAERARSADEDISPLVNKFLDQYHSDRSQDLLADSHVDQFINEFDKHETDLEAQIEAMRDSFDEIRETIESARGEYEQFDESEQADFDQLHDQFTEFKHEDLKSAETTVDWSMSNRDPDNVAIQQQAERHGITAEELVNELEQRDVAKGFVEAEADR